MINRMYLGLAAAVPILSFSAAASAQDLPVESRIRVAVPVDTPEILDRKHRFAACLVQRHRTDVVLVLAQAPGSRREAEQFDHLASRWTSCARFVTEKDVQTEPRVIRGALAEALYDADFGPATPPAVRQRASGRRAAPVIARLPATHDIAVGMPTLSGVEPGLRYFAACAAAASPGTGGSILETAPGSNAEKTLVEAFIADNDLCFRDDGDVNVNIPTIRGFVAEEVYRRAAATARRETVSAPAPRQRRARLVIDRAAPASGLARPLAPEEAGAILEFAQCVAESLPEQSEQALAQHLEGVDGEAFNLLARRRWMCSPEGRPIMFSRALFAGGIAEALLRRQGGGLPTDAEPSTSGPAVPPGSAPQSIALCIVRNAPGGVANLLATRPASASEEEAVESLLAPGENCVPSTERLRTSPQALRALVAVAAYSLTRPEISRSN